MIDCVEKCGQRGAYFTPFSCIPSRFANVLIANSNTADWLMPSRSASSTTSSFAVSLMRILVCFLTIVTAYYTMVYNTSTCKPVV